MSESKPVNFEAIPTEAIITIEISGAFYARLHSLLMYHSKQKNLNEFTQALAALKAGEPRDEYESQLLTILTLIHQVEHDAKEQGKIKTIETDKFIKKDG